MTRARILLWAQPLNSCVAHASSSARWAPLLPIAGSHVLWISHAFLTWLRTTGLGRCRQLKLSEIGGGAGKEASSSPPSPSHLDIGISQNKVVPPLS